MTPIPALSTGACAVWPFGASRDGGAARESLFAAADQPVVAFMRDGAGLGVTHVTALPFAVTIVPLGAERHALVVHDAEFGGSDPASLVAAATARARRRGAGRPTMRVPSGDEPFASGEYDLRRELRRVGPGVIALADATSSGWACAVLALFALGDGGAADELLRSAAGGANGAAAALALGASAIWRGTAPETSALRAEALEWMRAAAVRRASVGDDELATAALALAPAAAESLGALDVVASLRSNPLPDAAGALRALTAEAAATPAGSVLRAMHDVAGIAPDAMRGRVGIRPVAIAQSLEIEQIVVGDGVLAYRAEIGAEHATFEVEQTSGGSPLTVLLEPRVPGRRLRSARVDDTRAELDAVPEESDLRVKVQLVADRPRRLELHYER